MPRIQGGVKLASFERDKYIVSFNKEGKADGVFGKLVRGFNFSELSVDGGKLAARWFKKEVGWLWQLNSEKPFYFVYVRVPKNRELAIIRILNSKKTSKDFVNQNPLPEAIMKLC